MDILSFDGYEIEKLDYEETEVYQIQRCLFEDRKRILSRIIDIDN
ncbi:hypothetical protein [Metaclostridioides mangenotii]|nr:hypothetical protein [Clostridioides mangenotii]